MCRAGRSALPDWNLQGGVNLLDEEATWSTLGRRRQRIWKISSFTHNPHRRYSFSPDLIWTPGISQMHPDEGMFDSKTQNPPGRLTAGQGQDVMLTFLCGHGNGSRTRNKPIRTPAPETVSHCTAGVAVIHSFLDICLCEKHLGSIQYVL